MDPSSSRVESPLTEFPVLVRLWLKLEVGGTWFPVLEVPPDDINLYTFRPLKWLRFLGFVIYGREGTLYGDPDGPEVDDYDTSDVEILRENYYYFALESPRLADVQGLSDRASDAYTHFHSSQRMFRDDIVSRDGTCVMSGAARLLCDSAHLIPHSKGDAYIRRFTEFRGDSEDDIITDISDPRNGLLLGKGFHAMFGPGFMAFLKTPNFALTSDDVPPSTRPVSGSSGRLTLQYFCDPDPTLTIFAPFNQDARPPKDLTTWPPSIITDFVYACAAFRKWGLGDARATLRQLTQDLYYKDDPLEQGPTSRRENEKRERENQLKRRNEQKSRKGKSMATPPEEEEVEMGEIMDWIMCLWSMHARPRKSQDRGSEEWLQEWLRRQRSAETA